MCAVGIQSEKASKKFHEGKFSVYSRLYPKHLVKLKNLTLSPLFKVKLKSCNSTRLSFRCVIVKFLICNIYHPPYAAKEGNISYATKKERQMNKQPPLAT